MDIKLGLGRETMQEDEISDQYAWDWLCSAFLRCYHEAAMASSKLHSPSKSSLSLEESLSDFKLSIATWGTWKFDTFFFKQGSELDLYTKVSLSRQIYTPNY